MTIETHIEAPRREDLGQWSSWVDPRTGILEEATFFGSGPSKLFGCLHMPVGEPIGGLVTCCPFQAELLRNYRREVLLARHLAAHGIAVQRFHYRGSGHSDGDTADATFETMREDALVAAEHLGRRTGASSIAFMGTRWGGLAAAAATAENGGHLALWEPILDTQRYFDEVLRFRLMYEMKEDPSTTLSDAALLEEMHRTGSVDVLGHTLELRLYESALGRTLSDAVGDRTSSALLVQISLGRGLRKDYAAVAESWRKRGLAVETHVIPDRETWWISGDLWQIHETHAATRRLIEVTGDWAVRRLTRGGAV